MNRKVPFESLPLQQHHPPFSAWGLWGEDDELGALNLLTPAVVKSASDESIRVGLTIPLNLPINAPVRPMNPVRKPCVHRIIAKGHANDDELDINTQGSSHFDGLRHYPYQDTPLYYNGATQDDISGVAPNGRLGIHNAARKSIVGRGVLLDWARYAERKGIAYSPFERHAIPLWQIQEVAEEQHIQFQQGDILLIRTGWTKAYLALSEEEKLSLPDREVRASCGVEASVESLKWHWDMQFAAVVSDTVAYEAWPSPRTHGFCMHEVFLSGWGMMIGESWDLEELSNQCSRLGRWTFFLSSSPLDIFGGVASPSNAIAIL